MEIYLIRHGIAEDRSKYDRDGDRPLTNKGSQKTVKVAQRLINLGLKFKVILTSPLLRAKQTAKILQEEGLSEKVEIFSPLAPEGNIGDFVNWLQQSRYNEAESSVALVGHQPNLGNWAEKLVGNSSNERIILKKSGIIGLRLTLLENPIPKAELFLLTSPKWIINEP
jgi:phosphohistidine phosphatase